MKAAALFTIVGSLATTVSAQINLPSCANDCVTGQLPKQCGMLDIHCICSDKNFLTNISCCVKTKCSPADQAATIQSAQNLCMTAGVNVGSTSASCPSTSAPVGGSSMASLMSTTSAGSMIGSIMSSATGSAGITSSASVASSANAATSPSAVSTTASTGGAFSFVGQGLGAAGAAAAALALL